MKKLILVLLSIFSMHALNSVEKKISVEQKETNEFSAIQLIIPQSILEIQDSIAKKLGSNFNKIDIDNPCIVAFSSDPKATNSIFNTIKIILNTEEVLNTFGKYLVITGISCDLKGDVIAYIDANFLINILNSIFIQVNAKNVNIYLNQLEVKLGTMNKEYMVDIDRGLERSQKFQENVMAFYGKELPILDLTFKLTPVFQID